MLSIVEVTKKRLVQEVFSSVVQSTGAPKVLILDTLTLSIVSGSCRLSDLVSVGIPLIELLQKRREPQHGMEAIYFIHPSEESIDQVIDDMAASPPMYTGAHLFFTTKPSDLILSMIVDNMVLGKRIRSLKAVNLEYFATDSRSFVTDHPLALQSLFSPRHVENGGEYTRCLAQVASRLVTFFASLKEHPLIRYKSNSSAGTRPTKHSAKATHCWRNAPCQLAGMLASRIHQLANEIEDFPKYPTCDFLVVDRTVDLVSPLIHEWSYRGLVQELLPVQGNKFEYGVQASKDGKAVPRTVLLDETDLLWVQLRDKPLPKVFLLLCELVETIKQVKSKASSQAESSYHDLRELIQKLPDYLSQKDHVDNHIQMASLLSARVQGEGLREAGLLEEALIFGEGEGTKKGLCLWLDKFMGGNWEARVRLLALYALTKPGKFDSDSWQKAAGLQASDMAVVDRLALLGADVSSRQSLASKFKPSLEKKKKKKGQVGVKSKLEKLGLRPTFRHTETEDNLFRFYPHIRDLAEDLSQGSLNLDEFPAMNQPSPEAQSRRSAPKWANQSEDSGNGEAQSRRRGKRTILFVLGGMTHSEVRSIHWLSEHLGRDFLLGSTSLDTSSSFLQNLREME